MDKTRKFHLSKKDALYKNNSGPQAILPLLITFCQRRVFFFQDVKAGINNKYESPMYDLLRTVLIFDMVNVVMNFNAGTHWYAKSVWKKMIWEKAWCIEDKDWR